MVHPGYETSPQDPAIYSVVIKFGYFGSANNYYLL